jgi:hypothetical protein
MATTKSKPKKPPTKRSKRVMTPEQRLVYLCRELDVEMDGVSPIPQTAAAILMGIRRVLNDYYDET